MALFGEQIDYDIPASRNCSDFLEAIPSPISTADAQTLIQIKWLETSPSCCKTLLVGLPGCGATFLRGVLDSNPRVRAVGVLYNALSGLDDVLVVPPESASSAKTGRLGGTASMVSGVIGRIHDYGTGTLCVTLSRICDPQCAPGFAIDLLEQIPGLQHSQVFLLDSLSRACLKGHQDLGFIKELRMLCCSSWNRKDLCDELPPPNVVNGLCAALLSYCQMHQVSAAAFFTIRQSHLFLEREELACFEKLLPLALGIPAAAAAVKVLSTSKAYSNMTEAGVGKISRGTAHLYL